MEQIKLKELKSIKKFTVVENMKEDMESDLDNYYNEMKEAGTTDVKDMGLKIGTAIIIAANRIAQAIKEAREIKNK